MSFVHTRGPLPVVKSNLNAPTAPIANRADATDFNNMRQALLDLAAFVESYVGTAVTEFGADPTGAVDSSGAFNAAMAAGKLVAVSAGTYLLNSSISIPQDTTLRLLPGAKLLIAAPILMNANHCRLIGSSDSINSFTASSANCDIVWVGAPNVSMFNFATTAGNTGCVVKNLIFHGGAIAGITAMIVSDVGGGGAACTFENIGILETFKGIDIRAGQQSSTFRNIFMNNAGGGINDRTVGSQGLTLKDVVGGGAVTNLKFYDIQVQGFESDLKCGDSSSNATGCANASFYGCLFESLPLAGGCAIKLLAGGPYRFYDVFVEGPGPGCTTTRGVIVGSATPTTPTGIAFFGGNFHGFNSGTIVEIFSHLGFALLSPYADYASTNGILISNVHSGPVQQGVFLPGVSGANLITVAGDTFGEPEFHNNDTTGFMFTGKTNAYMDGTNKTFPTWHTSQYVLATPNNTNHKLCNRSFAGLLLVIDNSGNSALVVTRGSLSTGIDILANTGGTNYFRTDMSAPGSHFLFYDAGTNSWRIENRVGNGASPYTVVALGN